MQTNWGARNGRIVRIDPRNPAEANWTTIVPERTEKLQGASTAGGFSEEPTHTDVYYTFATFTAPPMVYRYDIATGRSTVVQDTKVPVDPSQFKTRQVFFTSKDGTRVPMFIIARTGLALNGTNPTVVFGYCGFNIAELPPFSASRISWLEQGGVWVTVNLRGGSEYGDAWHEAGMKEKKQIVFDEFIAAAEWLVANQYTSPEWLCGSHSGLLVGAVMTQRSELFKVALPAVGVMDRLRFHTFTIGWNRDYTGNASPMPDATEMPGSPNC